MKRILLILLFAIILPLHSSLAKERVLVFAAASLKDVIEHIADDFEPICKCEIVLSFAGSGTLARQINAGAKADIFISADQLWTDWLIKRDAFSKEAIEVIAANELVAIVPKEQAQPGSKEPLFSDLNFLQDLKRIAVSEPESVPAGRYARQALSNAGKWKELNGRMAFTENVRITLRLAARGDVDAAIVYRSDTYIDDNVQIAYRFPPDSHAPIIYPAALINAKKPASGFFQYLGSQQARSQFQKFGFVDG